MQNNLAFSFSDADMIFAYVKNIQWDLHNALIDIEEKVRIFRSLEAMANDIVSYCRKEDVVLVMSNGPFENLYELLIKKLRRKYLV